MNNWKTLELFLKNQRGYIDNTFGGRYIFDADMNINDRSDINKICWRIFDASQRNKTEEFKQLPNDERLAARNVIKELRRLYDETETALSKSSCVSSIATRVYDLCELRHDGFQPIDRLEDVVLYELDHHGHQPIDR